MVRYSTMLVRALKECPQGQQPGQVFEVPEIVANILIAAGAVTPTAESQKSQPEPVTGRRRYRRRDIAAES
jgi:hypothetical protein